MSYHHFRYIYMLWDNLNYQLTLTGSGLTFQGNLYLPCERLTQYFWYYYMFYVYWPLYHYSMCIAIDNYILFAMTFIFYVQSQSHFLCSNYYFYMSYDISRLDYLYYLFIYLYNDNLFSFHKISFHPILHADYNIM